LPHTQVLYVIDQSIDILEHLHRRLVRLAI
jgi:hypothetical protein